MSEFKTVDYDIMNVKTDMFAGRLPATSEEQDWQLEQNILNDKAIFDPFVIWRVPETGEVQLVDGNHRLAVLRNHPELAFSYTVEEADFDNEWSAFAWMCTHALGRRNMTSVQEKMVYAQYNNAIKMKQGGLREYGKDESEKFDARKATAEKFGVSPGTVQHANELKMGIEAGELVSPGFQKDVESGHIKAPQSMLTSLADVPKEHMEEAVEAVRKINSDNTSAENKKNKEEAQKVIGRYTQADIDRISAGLEGFSDDPFGANENEGKEKQPEYTEWLKEHPEEGNTNEFGEMAVKSTSNFERFRSTLESAVSELNEISEDTDFDDEMFLEEEKHNIIEDLISDLFSLATELRKKTSLE